jgi:hypothetical protein
VDGFYDAVNLLMPPVEQVPPEEQALFMQLLAKGGPLNELMDRSCSAVFPNIRGSPCSRSRTRVRADSCTPICRAVRCWCGSCTGPCNPDRRFVRPSC